MRVAFHNISFTCDAQFGWEASGKERQGKGRHMLRDTYQLAPERPLRSLKLMLCVGLSCPWIPSKRPALFLFSALLCLLPFLCKHHLVVLPILSTPFRKRSQVLPIFVPSPFLLGFLPHLACLIA